MKTIVPILFMLGMLPLALLARETALQSEERVWSGKLNLTARIVKLTDNNVELITKSGTGITAPLTDLSRQDLNYLAGLINAQKMPVAMSNGSLLQVEAKPWIKLDPICGKEFIKPHSGKMLVLLKCKISNDNLPLRASNYFLYDKNIAYQGTGVIVFGLYSSNENIEDISAKSVTSDSTHAEIVFEIPISNRILVLGVKEPTKDELEFITHVGIIEPDWLRDYADQIDPANRKSLPSKPIKYDKLLDYNDVTVTGFEKDFIRIMHRDGIKRIPIRDLPQNVKVDLGL